jgi:large subunit ribosomal protein L13
MVFFPAIKPPAVCFQKSQAYLSMNCYQAKTGELSRQWYVIDASEQVVGRLAAQIAPILMGKHRPTYTPHIDTGDYVIVTNVDKVVFTGNKWQEKSYQRYSGYPGGQRDEAAWKLFQRRPERILELAIQRMLPKSKLGRQMIDKLKLVVGAEHPHQAQQPIPLEPLSGRPAPAGALFAPPPVPRGARKKDGKVTEPGQATPSSEKAHAHVHAHEHEHAHDQGLVHTHAHEHAHTHVHAQDHDHATDHEHAHDHDHAHDHEHAHDHGSESSPPAAE